MYTSYHNDYFRVPVDARGILPFEEPESCAAWRELVLTRARKTFPSKSIRSQSFPLKFHPITLKRHLDVSELLQFAVTELSHAFVICYKPSLSKGGNRCFHTLRVSLAYTSVAAKCFDHAAFFKDVRVSTTMGPLLTSPSARHSYSLTIL